MMSTAESTKCPTCGRDDFADSNAVKIHQTKAHSDRGRERPWRDSSRLRELYWDEQLTLSEVADKLGCSGKTIQKWLDRHGIERRDGHKAAHPDLRDADELYRQHWVEERSVAEIAEKYDCTHKQIRRWFSKHGVDIRTPGSENTECPTCGREDFASREGLAQHHARSHGETLEEYEHRTTSHGGVQCPTCPRDDFDNQRALRVHHAKIHDEPLGRVSVECHRCGEQGRVPDHDAKYERWFCSTECQNAWHAEYMSEQRQGKEFTEEHRRKISEVKQGVAFSEDHRRALREAWEDRDPVTVANIEVDTTGHTVSSGWEKEIDLLLHSAGVEYGYEAHTFEIGDSHRYTPDFVTEGSVVEVKGQIFDDWSIKRAERFMKHHPEYEYIVVGNDGVPCDQHIPWDDREQLIEHLSG